MSRTQSILVTVAIAIVAVAGGMYVSRTLLQPDVASAPVLAKGTYLEPTRPLPEFQFVDHTNKAFTPARLKGKWSLMFFGFTNCPDICPATLTILSQVDKLLADLPAADRPQILLFSVDPQRDTPEHLARYVTFFGPAVVGVTGEPEAMETFTRELGVPVAIHELSDGNYTVDHSAMIFMLDPNGELRTVFSMPHEAPVIAADYRLVVSPAT